MDRIGFYYSIGGKFGEGAARRLLALVDDLGYRIGSDTADFGSEDDSETVRYLGDDGAPTELVDRDDAVARFITDSRAEIKISHRDRSIDAFLGHYVDPTQQGYVNVDTRSSHWTDEGATNEQTGEMLFDHLVAIHEVVDDRHVYSLSTSEDVHFEFEVNRWDEQTKELKCNMEEMIGWFTIFGEQGVDRYGRDRLLEAPAWRVEELDGGDVMMVLTEDPTDYHGYKTTYNRIRSHLGLEHLPKAEKY